MLTNTDDSLGLSVFDAAEYLDTPEAVQAYLNEATKTCEPAYIAYALGTVARAKGMSDLAKRTGLSRETLYRTLSDKGNPNLKTLIPIISALGVTLTLGEQEPA